MFRNTIFKLTVKNYGTNNNYYSRHQAVTNTRYVISSARCGQTVTIIWESLVS